MKTRPIITLDGPAGVGKSTLARRVASLLNMPYLDTGAMFRSVALRLGPGAEKLPTNELLAWCSECHFQLQGVGGQTELLCNGTPVGDEIRTEEVGQLASRLATVTTVRDYLKDAQRELGESFALVVEGRDMGTVVFPFARFKFFLDASPDIRALRRYNELKAKGEHPDLTSLTKLILQRDETDRNRSVAPLKPAPDARIIDTSNLDIDEVLESILESLRESAATIIGAIRCSSQESTLFRNGNGKSASEQPTLVPPHSNATFSHLKDDGSLSMVDVGDKAVTHRVAVVRGEVHVNTATLQLLKDKALPKGDVLVTAQVAGIMAAKRTSELIPLCHPVPLTFADVRFSLQDSPPAVLIEAETRTADRTGVEMEAILAAQTAAATIYDMCKAVQRDIVIRNIHLVHKSGGRSGTFSSGAPAVDTENV